MRHSEAKWKGSVRGPEGVTRGTGRVPGALRIVNAENASLYHPRRSGTIALTWSERGKQFS